MAGTLPEPLNEFSILRDKMQLLLMISSKDVNCPLKDSFGKVLDSINENGEALCCYDAVGYFMLFIATTLETKFYFELVLFFSKFLEFLNQTGFGWESSHNKFKQQDSSKVYCQQRDCEFVPEMVQQFLTQLLTEGVSVYSAWLASRQQIPHLWVADTQGCSRMIQTFSVFTEWLLSYKLVNTRVETTGSSHI